MHFMFLILAFLLVAVVWGYFHSNPQGVPALALHAFNAVVLGLGLAAGGVTASVLYQDAAAKDGGHGMAIYLAIMAAGTVFMIVVAAGGLLRNLLVFPLSRRAAQPARDGG